MEWVTSWNHVNAYKIGQSITHHPADRERRVFYKIGQFHPHRPSQLGKKYDFLGEIYFFSVTNGLESECTGLARLGLQSNMTGSVGLAIEQIAANAIE